jgi:hypothetical protein
MGRFAFSRRGAVSVIKWLWNWFWDPQESLIIKEERIEAYREQYRRMGDKERRDHIKTLSRGSKFGYYNSKAIIEMLKASSDVLTTEEILEGRLETRRQHDLNVIALQKVIREGTL